MRKEKFYFLFLGTANNALVIYQSNIKTAHEYFARDFFLALTATKAVVIECCWHDGNNNMVSTFFSKNFRKVFFVKCFKRLQTFVVNLIKVKTQQLLVDKAQFSCHYS